MQPHQTEENAAQDFVAELTASLAQSINEEIDQEIIDYIRAARSPEGQPGSRTYLDGLAPEASGAIGVSGARPYLDVGYFYAPYVPIMRTPVVLDPDTSINHHGVLTRYGRRSFREARHYYERTPLSSKEDKGDPTHLKYDPRYGF